MTIAVCTDTVTLEIINEEVLLIINLVDDDEKVASSKKKYKDQDWSTKTVPPFISKMAKIDAIFITKTAEKPYLDIPI